MRTIIGGALLALTLGVTAGAQTHSVSGYTRANGTYVAPHESANPGYGSSSSSFGGGYTNPEDHQVSGYTSSSGTYVNSYRASNSNATRQDNYSTQGNVNPYTGVPGTKPPY